MVSCRLRSVAGGRCQTGYFIRILGGCNDLAGIVIAEKDPVPGQIAGCVGRMIPGKYQAVGKRLNLKVRDNFRRHDVERRTGNRIDRRLGIAHGVHGDDGKPIGGAADEILHCSGEVSGSRCTVWGEPGNIAEIVGFNVDPVKRNIAVAAFIIAVPVQINRGTVALPIYREGIHGRRWNIIEYDADADFRTQVPGPIPGDNGKLIQATGQVQRVLPVHRGCLIHYLLTVYQNGGIGFLGTGNLLGGVVGR